jgi:hypothetical protein
MPVFTLSGEPMISATEVRALQAKLLDPSLSSQSILQELIFRIETAIRIQCLVDPEFVKHTLYTVPKDHERSIVLWLEASGFKVERNESADDMGRELLGLKIMWS